MKPLLAMLCVLILPQIAQGQDFSKISWGMTIDEVREAEGQALKKSLGSEDGYGRYYYQASEQASVYFYEYDGQVLQGAVMNMFSAAFKQHIETYLEEKEAYSEFYGAPLRDEIVWLDATYKDTPDKWTSALILGHLVYQTDWQTDTSLIRMTLRSWDYSLYLSVYYRSLAHQARIEQDDQQRYDLLGEDVFNGFTRYSQDQGSSKNETTALSPSETTALSPSKTTALSPYEFIFDDHEGEDHELGLYPLADHSLEELNREYEAVKEAQRTVDCVGAGQARCEYLKELRTGLERELAKRK